MTADRMLVSIDPKTGLTEDGTFILRPISSITPGERRCSTCQGDNADWDDRCQKCDVMGSEWIPSGEPVPASLAHRVDVDDVRDAARYRWLRERDLDTIEKYGGVFAGKVPQNVIINGDDLDEAVDAALRAAGLEEGNG